MVPAPVDPALSTNAACGSEEKILILQARAAARLPLFHPGDNRHRINERPLGRHNCRRELPAGVTWDYRRRIYRATAPAPTVNGKRIHAGYHRTVAAAVAAIAAVVSSPDH